MSRIVIQGAGIAGCALALQLGRAGHEVTVVERAPAPRSGGQAVDVRGAALKVLEQMGLADDIRARRTRLRGMSVYDESGKEIETTTERTLSGGPLDSEDIELFRDDLAKILFEKTEKHVVYCFGDEIRSLHEHVAGVEALLVSGERRMVDLVVGADGLRSGVRRLAFGPDDVHLRPLESTPASTLLRTALPCRTGRSYSGRRIAAPLSILPVTTASCESRCILPLMTQIPLPMCDVPAFSIRLC
jgi:2-polyprenyl-6-methoxyphenol hydroxylase-like FAD-dependent oxidoreductase